MVTNIHDSDERLTGDAFRTRAFDACKQLGRVFESTYGPYGLNTLLVDHIGDTSATNSGGRILDMMHIDDPVSQLVADACDPYDHVGDGTSFRVLLAAALVEEAESLIEDGLSPATVASGYARGCERTEEAIEDIAVPLELNRTEQYALAKTATSMRFTEVQREHLRDLLLDAVAVLAPDNVGMDAVEFEEDIRLWVEKSRAVRGAIVRSDPPRDPPDVLRDASVLLLEEGIVPPRDEEGEDHEEAPLRVTNYGDFDRMADWEKGTLIERTREIAASGADVVACSGHLHDRVVNRLTESGVLVLHELDGKEFDRIHRAVGGEATIAVDIPGTALGRAGQVTVSEIGAGTRPAIIFGECDTSEIVTIIVNGGTSSVAAEVRRTVTQGLTAVSEAYEDPRAVPGAGAAEIEAARRLRDETGGGREIHAVEAFADALERPVVHLLENCGFHRTDVVPSLRAAHDRGDVDAGVDVDTGQPMSAYEHGVIEPARLKLRSLEAATDAATQVLRTDAMLPGPDRSPEEQLAHEADEDPDDEGVGIEPPSTPGMEGLRRK